MAKVLVVGGAGYVGSATCAWLVDSGHSVWVLDNLTTGHRELVLGQKFIFGQAGDIQLVSDLAKREKFDCVMHFAARSLVSESVQKPAEYYENNVVQTRKLIEALLEGGVRQFVFSSTCAIFGDPGQSRIHEDLPKRPATPYGQNKLDVEHHLEQCAKEKNFQSISLRYFNAAGAEPKNRVGEWHEAESHLIPRVLASALKEQPVEVYGTDYPTPDGTCIRDYVHVWKLAQAHGLAMERLLTQKNNSQGFYEAYNLGSEKGFSVREIIQACESVTQKQIKLIEKPRRPGDPPQLVADSTKAKKCLGFESSHSDLNEIISSAWAWEKKKNGIFRRAIFLDRDGTINEDPGYLSQPEQMNLLPGVGESLARLQEAGYLLVVISNQSGVARGLIDINMIPVIHQRLEELLRPWSVRIARYGLCYHHPNDLCDCRKPKPKLIQDSAEILKIDTSQSFMVGDNISDLEAGIAAGCKGSILVRTGKGASSVAQLKPGQAVYVGDSLLDVTNWILSQENVSS